MNENPFTFKELKMVEEFSLRLIDGVHHFSNQCDEFSNHYYYDNYACITEEAYLKYKNEWINARAA